MKNKLLLATIALSLIMCPNSYAGMGQSHLPAPEILPPIYIQEIKSIREDFIKILSGDLTREQKRLTVMIVPFSNTSTSGETISRNRSGTLSTLPHPIPISDASKYKSGRILRKHKSEGHLGLDPLAVSIPKKQRLTGYNVSPEQIPVACGEIKSRILSLVSKPDLNNAQKLSILQKLCAPCSKDQNFIFGNISEIINLNPREVASIEASLENLSSGLLSICCTLKNGDQLVCFV